MEHLMEHPMEEATEERSKIPKKEEKEKKNKGKAELWSGGSDVGHQGGSDGASEGGNNGGSQEESSGGISQVPRIGCLILALGTLKIHQVFTHNDHTHKVGKSKDREKNM